MKTMLMRNGDFVLSTNRDLSMATGTGKVTQDLRHALLEPLGNDRFHPGWGSTLEEFPGQVADPATVMDVEAEVRRVVNNYAAVQRDKVEADAYSDGDARYKTNEILAGVTGITSRLDGDRLRFTLGVTTASGDTTTVSGVL